MILAFVMLSFVMITLLILMMLFFVVLLVMITIHGLSLLVIKTVMSQLATSMMTTSVVARAFFIKVSVVTSAIMRALIIELVLTIMVAFAIVRTLIRSWWSFIPRLLRRTTRIILVILLLRRIRFWNPVVVVINICIFKNTDLSKRVGISSVSHLSIVGRRPNSDPVACAKEHHGGQSGNASRAACDTLLFPVNSLFGKSELLKNVLFRNFKSDRLRLLRDQVLFSHLWCLHFRHHFVIHQA